MKTAIIIPARYASTRFPGKPLAVIGGQSMLSRVVDIGRQVIENRNDTSLYVATEDQRIADHAQDIGIDCIITSDQCPTGSDRVLEAADKTGIDFTHIISLQGDAPFTPPEALHLMLDKLDKNPDIEVITPVVPLRWNELDALREAKRTTPFSGTTAIVDSAGKAKWFSKNIIPAIRKEDNLKTESEYSPVNQHLGLYGYRLDILRRFVNLPQGHYEQLEGLEQLRFLENDITIQTVTLELESGLAQAGVDSPEDLERAEKALSKN